MSEHAVCRLCQPNEEVDGNIFDHLNCLHPGWDEGGTPITDVTAPFEYRTMRECDLEPHGARCCECMKLFKAGDPYTERPSGFAGDTPVVEIICLGCAGL